MIRPDRPVRADHGLADAGVGVVQQRGLLHRGRDRDDLAPHTDTQLSTRRDDMSGVGHLDRPETLDHIGRVDTRGSAHHPRYAQTLRPTTGDDTATDRDHEQQRDHHQQRPHTRPTRPDHRV